MIQQCTEQALVHTTCCTDASKDNRFFEFSAFGVKLGRMGINEPDFKLVNVRRLDSVQFENTFSKARITGERATEFTSISLLLNSFVADWLRWVATPVAALVHLLLY